jgi:hypothetical protein
MHLLVIYPLVVWPFCLCLCLRFVVGCWTLITDGKSKVCSLIFKLSLTILKFFIIYSYFYHPVTLFVFVNVFFLQENNYAYEHKQVKAIDAAEFDFVNIGDCATISGSKLVDRLATSKH